MRPVSLLLNRSGGDVGAAVTVTGPLTLAAVSVVPGGRDRGVVAESDARIPAGRGGGRGSGIADGWGRAGAGYGPGGVGEEVTPVPLNGTNQQSASLGCG